MNPKLKVAVSCILLSTILLTFSNVCYAANAPLPDIKVMLEGQEIKQNVAPIIVNGSTLIQAKVIFEALGAEIKWDAKTKIVTGTKGDLTVTLQINSKTARVNGRGVTIDVPAMIKNNCTMVPLRFVAETFKLFVYYDAENRTVYLTPNEPVKEEPTAVRELIAEGVYKVPLTDLGEAQLTNDQIRNLGNKAADLQKSISTLADVINYLTVNKFEYQTNLLKSVDNGMIWTESRNPELVIQLEKSNYGETAWLTRYLLDKDYDTLGFVCVYSSVAREFNYFVHSGKIYVLNVSSTFSDMSEVILYEVDSIKAFSDYYCELRGNVRAVVSYVNDRCLPVAFDAKNYILYFPNEYVYEVIYAETVTVKNKFFISKS